MLRMSIDKSLGCECYKKAEPMSIWNLRILLDLYLKPT